MTDAQRALQDALARATAQVADLTDELDGIIESAVGANLDDEHDPDGSTVGFERARVTALLAEATRHLASLQAAASRAADGDYGICVRCGAVIPAERLDAIPDTEMCTGCAASSTPKSGRQRSW